MQKKKNDFNNWPDNDYRYYLKHHGIKGQKWGDQNGPPYPLDASDHSSSEVRAGWQESLSSSSPSRSKAPGSSTSKRVGNGKIGSNRFKITKTTNSKGQLVKSSTSRSGSSGRAISFGRYGKGNIDLLNRPRYENEDGSISTVDSFSVNIKGKEVLLPTIGYDENGNPIRLTEEETIELYLKTGKYLGIFDTPEEATEYAIALHEEQEKLYDGKRDNSPRGRMKDVSGKAEVKKRKLNK